MQRFLKNLQSRRHSGSGRVNANGAENDVPPCDTRTCRLEYYAGHCAENGAKHFTENGTGNCAENGSAQRHSVDLRVVRQRQQGLGNRARGDHSRVALSIRRRELRWQIGLCAFVLALMIPAASVWAQNFADWTQDAEPITTTAEKDLAQASSTEEIMKMVEPPLGIALPDSTDRKYTLGPNDVIEVMVMRHPEVSGEYPINNEGKIQYGFVGDVLVNGLSKEEAAQAITQALSEYIVSPEVTVKITQYNSKIVYIVGEVFNPGKIYMRGDTITVREALMQAGLPRLSGVTKKSRLIRPSADGHPRRKMINVYALLYEGDLRQNAVMEPGDMLYIPPTFLTRVMRAISPVAAPVGQAAGVRVGAETLGGTQPY